jgi:UDP-galactopyranose mutase
MAANKAIVSTPIADVVESYDGAVMIAGSLDSFIEACEDALGENSTSRARRAVAMQDAVASTSWIATVRGMRDLMLQAMRTAAPQSENIKITATASEAHTFETEALVIGAGPTGLSAAMHLGACSVLLEQAPTVGGWCRSVVEGGFTFDHAGHIMFSKDPYVHDLYQRLLGENVHWQDREAWIHTDGLYTRYPFQGALFGLPADILKECLMGAIEARFGSVKEGASTGGPVKALDNTDGQNDCCADGVAMAPSNSAAGAVQFFRRPSASPKNFEEFIYKVWGAGVAKHFAIPYNRKLWTVPLSDMETSWLGGRVPLPDLEEMIEGALRPSDKPVGPNARFGYPLRGGFQALMDGFLPLLKGQLKLNARVARIDVSQHRAELTDGSVYRYEQLISTMPLPQLIGIIGAAAPPEVRQAAKELRHVSVRCVNLGIARPNITDKHWIYYAGDTVFHRIFLQGNASPHCNPPNGFGLTCEITYAPSKPLPCDGEALTDLCIADCVRTGLLRADDAVLVRNQIDMPYAYVIYDHARKQNVTKIQDWLAGFDIILAGRYSQWEYYNSDHAFVAGKHAAQTVLRGREVDTVFEPSVA